MKEKEKENDNKIHEGYDLRYNVSNTKINREGILLYKKMYKNNYELLKYLEDKKNPDNLKIKLIEKNMDNFKVPNIFNNKFYEERNIKK